MTHGKNIKSVEPELMGLFLGYHWPGNVRELRNAIERLVILSDNNKLRTDNLPEHLRIPALTPVVSNIGSVNLNEVTEQTERQVIMKILEEVNWNKSVAAKKLGVPRSTLYYKLKALKIL
jgi:transcriptional regulator of acetoin/glycerol metabolism